LNAGFSFASASRESVFARDFVVLDDDGLALFLRHFGSAVFALQKKTRLAARERLLVAFDRNLNPWLFRALMTYFSATPVRPGSLPCEKFS